MELQAQDAAQPRQARRSFGASRAGRAADAPTGDGAAAARFCPAGVGPRIGALLSAALLASVATPVMVALDMSGPIVAAPLFLAGLAVGAASLIRPSAKPHGAAMPVRPASDAVSAKLALPVADLFDASAFVVTQAGLVTDTNAAGRLMSRAHADPAEVQVFFDLLAPHSRGDAMAAIRSRRSDPVLVDLREGGVRRLHIVCEGEGQAVVAVLSHPVEAAASPRPAEPGSRNLSEAMLATVSHELRTPLNAIIGFSGILETELYGKLDSDRQREYVGLIQSSGQHLLSVVNDILDVSKIEAGAYRLQCEHFLLDELVDEACTLVRCQAQAKNLVLSVEGPSGGTMIHGDRRALHHMLVNLLSNAVKFTDAGTVTLSWERAGRDLKLWVADTGIGIPASEIGKLGMPFVQAEAALSRKYEGTGLGLAYVRGMSELHGGTMSIISQEGTGTTITLDLPLVPRQAANTEDQNIVALNHARKSQNDGLSHATQRRTA